MWIATIWNQEKLGGGIWILLHSTQLERRDELDGVYYSVRRRRSPHESRGNTYDRLDAHSGHLSPRSGSRSSARGPSMGWTGWGSVMLPSCCRRHWLRPSGSRCASCGQRSTPIPAAPAITLRCGPELVDRPQESSRARRYAAGGPAAARGRPAATPPRRGEA